MREIPLTQGKVALVDDKDYASLMLFKWYAKKSDDSWYAVRKQAYLGRSYRGRSVERKDKRKTIRMHNVIMQPNNNEIVHHKDGDGLNNQRYNLECKTLLGNQQEAAKKAGFYSDDVPF